VRNLSRRSRATLLLLAALGVVAAAAFAWVIANAFINVVMPETQPSRAAAEYTARVTIAAGAVVSEEMIAQVTVDETVLRVGQPSRDDIVHTASEVVGKQAMRRIVAGERLYRADFAPLPAAEDTDQQGGTEDRQHQGGGEASKPADPCFVAVDLLGPRLQARLPLAAVAIQPHPPTEGSNQAEDCHADPRRHERP